MLNPEAFVICTESTTHPAPRFVRANALDVLILLLINLAPAMFKVSFIAIAIPVQLEEFWLYFQHWLPLKSHQLPHLSITHSQSFAMHVLLFVHPKQSPPTKPQKLSEKHPVSAQSIKLLLLLSIPSQHVSVSCPVFETQLPEVVEPSHLQLPV
jgi:hypothetical protein